MNKHHFLGIFAFFCIISNLSCHEKRELTDDEIINNVADSFSTNYFTWHFDRAMRFSNDDMKHYLSFIASNVHEADINLLLSTSAIPSINVKEINMNGDTMATVIIDLKDVILMDTLGEEAHLRPNAQRKLTLKKGSDKDWKVTGIE